MCMYQKIEDLLALTKEDNQIILDLNTFKIIKNKNTSNGNPFRIFKINNQIGLENHSIIKNCFEIAQGYWGCEGGGKEQSLSSLNINI